MSERETGSDLDDSRAHLLAAARHWACYWRHVGCATPGRAQR